MSWLAETTRIYAGLRSRLSLREGPVAQSLSLEANIIPVTVIDDVLMVSFVGRVRTAVDPGGTGYQDLMVVPVNRRRRIRLVDVERVTGTTITFDVLAINRGGVVTRIFSQTGSSTLLWESSSGGFLLDSGDALQVSIAAYTTGTYQAQAIYEEEQAF